MLKVKYFVHQQQQDSEWNVIIFLKRTNSSLLKYQAGKTIDFYLKVKT